MAIFNWGIGDGTVVHACVCMCVCVHMRVFGLGYDSSYSWLSVSLLYVFVSFAFIFPYFHVIVACRPLFSVSVSDFALHNFSYTKHL